MKTPSMPAAALAERVGSSGSASLFRAKVAAIRPEYAQPDPVDQLVRTQTGFQAHCGLQLPYEPAPVGDRQSETPPLLVRTSAFSGFMQARMLSTRRLRDCVSSEESFTVL